MIRIVDFASCFLIASLLSTCLGVRDNSLELEHQLAGSTDNSSWWWHTCPKGMKTISQKGEETQCVWENLDLYIPRTPVLNSNAFRKSSVRLFETHSNKPLYFNRKSGSVNVTRAFAAEFFDALADNYTFHLILNDFGCEEMMKNETFAKQFAEWAENVTQTTYGDGGSDFWHGFHGLENSILPAFFILEHAVEHAAIGAAITMLHAIEVALEAELLFGEVFFANVFGVSLAHSAHAAGHYLHIVLHYVLTPLLVHKAVVMYLHWQQSYLDKIDDVEDFTNRLIMRPACVKDRLSLERRTFDELAFEPIIGEVCGVKQLELIAALAIRTHKVMEHVFDTISQLGECLNPAGEGKLDKVNCAHRMYRGLREQSELPGILWSSLVFMSTVMQVTDGLLIEPLYGNIMEDKFGVMPPPADKTSGFSEIEDIRRVANDTLEKRFLTCYSVIATHRAFELSLSRVAQSLTVYMKTFARRLSSANIRFHSWKPCQKVFFDANHEDGFCKDEKSKLLRHQTLALQHMPCSSSLNQPQWRCHSRSRLFGNDNLWCKHAGVFQGFEYRYYEHNSECGCKCCRRENAGNSLWPELEGGGHH